MHAVPGGARHVLKEAFENAVSAAHPGAALRGHLPEPPPGRLAVLAIGKAALLMAQTAASHYRSLGVRPEVLAVVPAGAPPAPEGIEVIRAGHPVPNQDSVNAGRRALEIAAGLGRGDLLLALISGGASALATVPAGITLDRFMELTETLLRSGADIHEMNTLRRKLCAVKGGGLALEAAPASVRSLLVSDVVGDDPAAIGSGPTVSDPGTPEDALAVLEKYAPGFDDVRTLLRRLPPARRTGNASHVVIAGAAASLSAAARIVARAGFRPQVISDSVEGDSEAAAREHALLLPARGERLALLSGGETTVTIPAGTAPGTGGRNSHYALTLALSLWGREDFACLAADTDGIDGHGDAAGAIVTKELFSASSRQEAAAALAAFNSHTYFAKYGQQLFTGPTGTNVNDLRIILTGVEA